MLSLAPLLAGRVVGAGVVSRRLDCAATVTVDRHHRGRGIRFAEGTDLPSCQAAWRTPIRRIILTLNAPPTMLGCEVRFAYAGDGHVDRRTNLSDIEKSASIMKSISASIIVLSGSGLVAVGPFVRHGDTSTFVMLVGRALALAGLVGWYSTLRSSDDS